MPNETSVPFRDLHNHFPLHTPFPSTKFENPLDFWKKPLFEAASRLGNYEDLKPRVSLERWFADTGASPVTGFGSALFDPRDEFLVSQKPDRDAFVHVVGQLKHVEEELRRSPRPVEVARTPAKVEALLKSGQRFVFHTLEGGCSLGGDAASVDKLADMGVASITPAHLFLPRRCDLRKRIPSSDRHIARRKTTGIRSQRTRIRDCGTMLSERSPCRHHPRS